MELIYAVPILLLVQVHCRQLPDLSPTAPSPGSGELDRSDLLSAELDRSAAAIDNELDPADRYGLLPTPNVAFPIDDPLIFPPFPTFLPLLNLPNPVVVDPFDPDTELLKHNDRLKKLHAENGKWPNMKQLVEIVPLRKKTKLNKALAYILPKTDTKKLMHHLSTEIDELIPDLSLSSEENWTDYDSEQNYSHNLRASDSSSNSISAEYVDYDRKPKHNHVYHSDFANNEHIKHKESDETVKNKIKNILAYLEKHGNKNINNLIHQISLATGEDPDYNFHYVVHKNIPTNEHKMNHHPHLQTYKNVNSYKQDSVDRHKIANDYEGNESNTNLSSEEELVKHQYEKFVNSGDLEKSDVQDILNHDRRGLLNSLLEAINENEPSNDLLSHIHPQLEDLLKLINHHKDLKSHHINNKKVSNAPHTKENNSNEFILYENPNHHINHHHIIEKQLKSEHIQSINELEDPKPHNINEVGSDVIAAHHNPVEDYDKYLLVLEDSKHHHVKEKELNAEHDINNDALIIPKDLKHYHIVEEIEHVIHNLINDNSSNSNIHDVHNTHHEHLNPNENNILNIKSADDNSSGEEETIEIAQTIQDSLAHYVPDPENNDEINSEVISGSGNTSDDYSEESVSSQESPESSSSSINESTPESDESSNLYPSNTKSNEEINISDIFHPAHIRGDIFTNLYDHNFTGDTSVLDSSGEEQNDGVHHHTNSAEINIDDIIAHDTLITADCCKQKKQKGIHSDDCTEQKSYKLTFLFNR